jgi:phosphatidylglycerol:prolipoprotein diacylglycerol transferase
MINTIVWDVSPTLFKIGPLEIRYYGLLWATSFLLGFSIVKKIFIKEGKPVELMDPLLYSVLIGAVLGARLGHVFFYDWQDYKDNLGDIFKIWEGGLASHGGAIGVLLGLFWFSKYKLKGSFLWITDRVVIAVALSAFCIRLGNFFNSEIVGTETTLPWGVEFKQLKYYPSGTVLHPAQMYEGLAYLFIFSLLIYFYKKQAFFPKEGRVLGLFLMLVFTVRFFVETVKESQGGIENNFGNVLTSGQILSIPFILIGVYLLFFRKKAV